MENNQNKNMDRLEYLSAYELGQKVNNKEIRPTEVISYFKNRILERNKDINAFVYTKFDEAMEVAKKQEEDLEKGKNLGPFVGVPFALKDFLANKPGWQSSHGGVKCLIEIDKEYSSFAFAMEKLGGIPLGKCNAPAYGFRGTTDNKMYGATSTPFNLMYNSGGSSGGSAAAVSDGLVLIAEGGDAGGSIRIPASFCNLYGFKAGVGIVPNIVRDDAYSTTHPFCYNGGLTKSVMDSAILLNAMKGFDRRDPNSVKKDIDYVSSMIEGSKNVNKLRIGYTFDFDLFPVDEQVKKMMNLAIEKANGLGAKVEEIKFNFKHTNKQMSDAWCKGITVDCAIGLNLLKEQGVDHLKDHPEDFPKEFIYWKNECDKMGIMDLYEFNLVRSDILDEFERVFKDYDLIISPISCVPYIKNETNGDTKGPNKINGVEVDPLIGWCETYLANFIGYPSASIPCGLYENNIPFGFQIIGKRLAEEDILSFSYAFESKYPWKDNFEIAFSRKNQK